MGEWKEGDSKVLKWQDQQTDESSAVEIRRKVNRERGELLRSRGMKKKKEGGGDDHKGQGSGRL